MLNLRKLLKYINYVAIIVMVTTLSTDGKAIRSRLYRYGTEAGDKKLPSFDETSSQEISLQTPIIYYGHTYDSIFVSTIRIVHTIHTTLKLLGRIH